MTLAPPLAAEQGWTTLNAPELVKWDKPGLLVCGVFVGIEIVKIEQKHVQQYTFQLGEKRFKTLAPYDLLQQLRAEHRGCQVRILYRGEDDSVRGGPNNTPMKRFSVQIKGTPTNGAQSSPITDEDIPF